MITARKTSFLAAVTLALLLLPASVSAQKSGFFFRGNVGPAYSLFSSDADLDIKGASGIVSLSFGKFVSRNLVLFGDIFGSSITGPTLESGGVEVDTPDDVTSTLSAIGGGVGYYSDSNIYLGASLGISFINIEWDDMGLEGRSDAGIGLSLIIGKDWQVGDKWNLGVAGHVIGGAIDDQGTTWTPTAFGVDFTFTYASGGIG